MRFELPAVPKPFYSLQEGVASISLSSLLLKGLLTRFIKGCVSEKAFRQIKFSQNRHPKDTRSALSIPMPLAADSRSQSLLVINTPLYNGPYYLRTFTAKCVCWSNRTTGSFSSRGAKS